MSNERFFVLNFIVISSSTEILYQFNYNHPKLVSFGVVITLAGQAV